LNKAPVAAVLLEYKLEGMDTEAVAYHMLSGFSEVPERTLPAPDNTIAPTEPPAVAVRNVHELAADYGIVFG
jgi:hypothetical protein